MNLAEKLNSIEDIQKDHQSRIEFLENLMVRVLKAQERTEAELTRLSKEMREFKNEMRLSIKELNKKWGDLANKMGTLAEDIIAPGLHYALRRTFGLEIKDLSVRRRRKLNGDEQEFDVIAVANGFVFLVDVKSVYRPQYLEDFQRILERFRKFFPELGNKKLVGVIAAFNLPEEIVSGASKRGWLALQMGGEYLEFLNPEIFRTN